MMQKMMSPVVDAASSQQQSHSVALFTLTFAHGEVALLTISGATDAHHARILAENAIAHCRYTITDGDVTNGHAHYFYYWHTREAQERNPRLDSRGARTCHSHFI